MVNINVCGKKGDNMKKETICLCLGLVIAVATMPAQSQETQPGARVKDLEKMVQELERRVSELEKQLSTKEVVTQPPGDLQGRVVQVEEQVRKIEEKEKEPGTFRAYWKDTLRFETADKAFRFRIGGRIMNDWGFLSGDDQLESAVGDLDDGAELGWARLELSGLLYDRVEFKTQYEFAGGEPDFRNVYLALVKLPVVGSIKVGHLKEPFGLEELTSTKHITLMQTSLTSAFTPCWNTGIMLHDCELDERMTWAAGLFRETDFFGRGFGDGEYNVTARLTGLPWYEEEGRKLFHLGVAYSHRNPHDDTLRYRQRPEVHLAPRFADTQEFAAETVDEVGAEAALVLGPLSLQGEFMYPSVSAPEGPNPSFSAFYAMASYFLTGENRAYNRSAGIFSQVKPRNNFLKNRGAGAWELAARYSHLDLNDGGIEGEELEDVTVGLNWYLNSSVRLFSFFVLATYYRLRCYAKN